MYVRPLGHIRVNPLQEVEEFGGPFALHFTVVEGRITRHRLYENSLSIAEACTL